MGNWVISSFIFFKWFKKKCLNASMYRVLIFWKLCLGSITLINSFSIDLELERSEFGKYFLTCWEILPQLSLLAYFIGRATDNRQPTIPPMFMDMHILDMAKAAHSRHATSSAPDPSCVAPPATRHLSEPRSSNNWYACTWVECRETPSVGWRRAGD